MGTRNYISTMVFEEEEENGNLHPEVRHMLAEETANNAHLRDENKSLTRELRQSDEEIQLLQHQLSVKSNSLRLLYEELDVHDGVDESDLSAVARDVLSNLQRKIKDLEQEKIRLRLKLDDNKQRMAEQEDIYDRNIKEHQRNADGAHLTIHNLEREITHLTDENSDQALELEGLLARRNNLERDLFQLELGNQRLTRQIDTSQFESKELHVELEKNRLHLRDIQRSYNETRQELTLLRFKQSPSPHRPRTYSDSLSFPPDSLARELEDTVLDDTSSVSSFRGVARSFSHPDADGKNYYRGSRDGYRSFGNTSGALQTARAVAVASARSAHALTAYDSNENHAHAHYFGDDTGCDQSESSETVPVLTEEEEDESDDDDDVDNTSLPDPILSEKIQARSKYPSFYRMVEIIKPVEGSYMLGKWKELATPNFTSFLDENDGVTSQFESHQAIETVLGKLDRSWSDCEEDDDPDYVSTSSLSISSMDEGGDDSGVDTSSSNIRLLNVSIPGSGTSLDNLNSISSEDENATSSSSSSLVSSSSSPSSSSLTEKIKQLGIQAATPHPSGSLPLQGKIVTTLAPHLSPSLPDSTTRGIDYIFKQQTINMGYHWSLSSGHWLCNHRLLTNMNLSTNMGFSDVVRNCIRYITGCSTKDSHDQKVDNCPSCFNLLCDTDDNSVAATDLLINAIKFHVPTSGKLKDGESPPPEVNDSRIYHDFSILEKLSLLRNNDDDLSPWKFETRNAPAKPSLAAPLPDESSLFDESENKFRPMFDVSVY